MVHAGLFRLRPDLGGVGASGLLVNPFYLNYGLMKEAMLATRAVNSLAIQLVKIGAYAMFGVLHWRLARHGLVAGAGAITAIWLVNPWLRHLSSFRFRQLAVFVMLFGGLLILWQQRAFLAATGGRRLAPPLRRDAPALAAREAAVDERRIDHRHHAIDKPLIEHPICGDTARERASPVPG